MSTGRPSRSETIFQPGDLLNNTYRIEAILGRGGTSEVYRARSEISGRVVALKALRWEFARNEDYLALMTREEDVREIRHDGIVRYFDTQRTDDGTVYLVMDHVEGPGLDTLLRDGGVSAADLLVIAERVADALAAAHARNIVHRDLSPDNIILRHGRPDEAVIIDFGIAKDTNPGAATIVGNEFAGKYAYAAPEQLSGDTDARSDVYALGALLLAAFRGRAPDAGANPMEVVQRKALPLDVSGVPEPLAGLIARMADPDRNARLQSAEAVLAAVRAARDASAPGGTGADAGGDDDRTVIVPRPRKTTPPPPPPRPATASAPSGTGASAGPGTGATARPSGRDAPQPRAETAAARRGGGAAMIAAGLVIVAALGTGGAWFAGLFDRAEVVPTASPFAFIAERSGDGRVHATGHVPSESMATALRESIGARGGATDLTLARGNIAADWERGLLHLIDLVDDLPEWRVAASDNRVRVTGLSLEPAEHRRLTAALRQDMPATLSGTADIELGPRILAPEAVQEVLARHADCGPLRLVNAPAAGYPNDATIIVLGRIARPETMTLLTEALAPIKGQRQLGLELEQLNPTLCTIDAALPRAPQGGFGVAFGFGDRDEPNPNGRYYVGENPVIDVIVPETATEGVLYVSALDVSGNVFHLLPNLYRPEHDLPALRAGRAGALTVRVAYGLGESDGPGKLAFEVDDTALGKTKILVLHADRPIFDELRPTTESAEAYAAALREIVAPVRSLDGRVLTTAARP